jgi:hypothetical protein
MKHTTCRKLGSDAVVRHVAIALAAAREADRSVRIPSSFSSVESRIIRQVPAWVARAGILKSARAWWLWCEPRRGRARDGQCVLDVPDGRYMVETLDTRTSTWVSCEAAAASPLVIGLPYTGRPVLACIRRVARATQVPRE